jgi:hypothetical protein
VQTLVIIFTLLILQLPLGIQAQTAKPATIADLATYTGADREKMLAAGAK